MTVGSATTRLIVLRGNSASGKSSVAAEVRARYGRGLALVAQDDLRRVVLRERDTPDGANIGLVGTVARYALDHGYHVVVEGILRAAHYGSMLEALRRDHRGRTAGGRTGPGGAAVRLRQCRRCPRAGDRRGRCGGRTRGSGGA